MKNQVLPLAGKHKATFGYSDEKIFISAGRLSSFASLQAIEPSWFKGRKVIPVSSLNEIYLNDEFWYFTLKFDADGKTKKVKIYLEDKSLIEPVVAEIASLKQLNKSIVGESKKKPLLWNLVWVFLIVLLTWGFRFMAIEAQSGNRYVATSGRRRGMNNLLAYIIEAIGPTGVVVIGVLSLLYMIFVTYKRYNNPESEIYYR